MSRGTRVLPLSALGAERLTRRKEADDFMFDLYFQQKPEFSEGQMTQVADLPIERSPIITPPPPARVLKTPVRFSEGRKFR